MILSHVEKAAVNYLASKYELAGYSISPSDGDVSVTIDGVSFRLGTGQTMSERTLPGCVAVCESGTEDFETGNQRVTLTLFVMWQADTEDQSDVDSKLELLNTESRRIEGWFRDSSIASLLNAERDDEDELTVIGFESVETNKAFDGHLMVHKLALGLYVAGVNLV